MRNDIIVLILATVVSFPLGLALGQWWLLPILNALPAYIVIVHRLRKGERGGCRPHRHLVDGGPGDRGNRLPGRVAGRDRPADPQRSGAPKRDARMDRHRSRHRG